MSSRILPVLILLHFAWSASVASDAPSSMLPRALDSYAGEDGASLWQVLQERVATEPFNLVASLIFLLAICHTFLTAKFRHWAHVAEEKYAARIAQRPANGGDANEDGEPDEVSFKGQILHFFGEVEAVFGLWVVVLAGAIGINFGWGAGLDYIGHKVNFTEAMFVVVIMALAGTRPVLRIAETCGGSRF